ncbi:MAG: hypothetical protein U0414_33555 [Polyangiaceae bacterium]
MKTTSVLLGMSVLCAACATELPGTHPTDMSVEAHERMAAKADGLAKAQEARRDVWGENERTRCGGRSRTEPCWHSAAMATPEYSRYRKLAAEHREAAQALRDAEASACANIAEEDRDVSPFADRTEIVAASDLTVEERPGDPSSKTLRGASITVQAVPGLSAEYLERVVSCHLARNASMGFAMGEMEFDPLAVKGASATVAPVDGGFRVDIQGNDRDAITEIAKRADALVASR